MKFDCLSKRKWVIPDITFYIILKLISLSLLMLFLRHQRRDYLLIMNVKCMLRDWILICLNWGGTGFFGCMEWKRSLGTSIDYFNDLGEEAFRKVWKNLAYKNRLNFRHNEWKFHFDVKFSGRNLWADGELFNFMEIRFKVPLQFR